MIRSALIASLIVLGVAPAIAQSPMRLKPAITVTGDIVRIGDLIENAGIAANTPVFRAPDLGETGSVPVRAVIDAVRPHGLVAIDLRGLSEVSVTHASRTIPAVEIEERIASTLTARYSLGRPENLKLVFEREVRAIQLPVTASGEPILARLSYEPQSRRFDLTFELASARAQWRYTGSAVETIEAAVPTRAFARGDVIKASDVVIERRPKSEFATEPPASAAAIAGLAARRAVRAGQPLRNADLMKPELVHKNDTVMLHYEVPGVVLSMRGKALDSGAEGDIVSVLNVNSKRTVQGIVTGPGRVTVQTPNSTRLAAASQSE